uniref:Putative permease of the major facilitator superfamily protein n=1 Tax=Tabanus bromius TaxID=304241 RepID=A0A0K8TRD0_TABBR
MTTAGKKSVKRGLGLLTCRQTLYLLTLIGFMLNYALRVNLTIAIVSMVDSGNTSQVVANCTTNSTGNSTDNLLPPFNETNPLDPNEKCGLPPPQPANKFDWDSRQQNLILGCFFWGYVLTELPGGRLAELIGGRRVFGHAMLWASVLTLLTPVAASLHYIALTVLRVLLGFLLGASWPAIHPIAAVWVPPMDRSKFIANMMASALGAAVTMPICGVLIDQWGWQSVFYATGLAGLVWSVAWFFLTFESPATHPRISPEERREIEEAIGSTTSKKRPSYVPWRSMLSSPPVWAIIITHTCSVLGYFTLINQLPTFMKHILQFNIKANGLLSSLPYLGKYLMAISASILADHLRKTGKMTTTRVRKMFTIFALFLPGVVMTIQIFKGDLRVWSVTLLTLTLTLNGAVTGGYLSNGLDIAPNFSGTIFGMSNTLSSIGGYLATQMVGFLTYQNQTFSAWQILFIILAVLYVLGAIVFTIFGSGDLQPWNNPPEKNDPRTNQIEMEEGVPLKEKHNHAT